MAAGTRVHDGDRDALVGFPALPYLDSVPADGVVIGVARVVKGHGARGERGDVLAVLVLVPAGAETDAGGVEGAVAFVDCCGEGCEGEEGEESEG